MKQVLLGRKRLNELANITKFKWRFDRRSGNCDSSNCKLTRKKFGDFNGIQIHGLCVSAAVLYQLSYEEPYIGSRPICWVHLNPRKEWNMEWRWCELRKYKFKWRYDRRSGNCNLSNCKLTRKKNWGTSTGSMCWKKSTAKGKLLEKMIKRGWEINYKGKMSAKKSLQKFQIRNLNWTCPSRLTQLTITERYLKHPLLVACAVRRREMMRAENCTNVLQELPL